MEYLNAKKDKDATKSFEMETKIEQAPGYHLFDLDFDLLGKFSSN